MVMWMAYAAGVAGLLAAGAFLLEKVSERTARPRRFAWIGGLSLALLVPLTASPPKSRGAADLPSAAGIEETGNSNGELGAVPGPGERAALFLWASASLTALLLVCAVLMATALARGRWNRIRIAGEDVYVSRSFGPALVGVTRPAIVIPRWVVRLGAAVGATVVRHEREHARARDHLTLLYGGVVVALMPWNPCVWWMFLRLRAAVEIDCDRRVLGTGIPAAEYGDLLIDIGARRPARQFFALTMAGSPSLLERRLEAMKNQRKRARSSALALLGCLALGAVVVACGMNAPTAIVPAVNSVLEEAAPAADDSTSDVNASAEESPEGSGTPDTEAPRGPGVPGPDAILAATDENGDIRIRGVRESPSLSMTPDGVARDPLVLVDGMLLEGGLKRLLASEPLDIEGIGYSRDPAWFEEFGDIGSRGIVIIRTAGSQAWGLSVPRTLESGELLDRRARQLAEDARQLGEQARQVDEEARRLIEDARRLARPPAQTRRQARRLEGARVSEDGGVLIRGISRLPSVRLTARSAARNPLVVVDGEPLAGGLATLLTAEPLDIRTAGYFGDSPRRFTEEFGRAAHRGIVFINTQHPPRKSGK